MTLTDSPRLAEASHDTVRDPDWILGRLTQIRADAERYAQRRGESRHEAEYQAWLDMNLKRLEAELRVWGSAADALVETLDAVPLPPLEWYRRVLGGVGRITAIPGMEHGDAERIRIAQQWAETLGLAEVEKPDSPGTRKWAGEMDGFEVSVWCITDRDAFYGKTEKAAKPITDNDPTF